MTDHPVVAAWQFLFAAYVPVVQHLLVIKADKCGGSHPPKVDEDELEESNFTARPDATYLSSVMGRA